MIDVDRPRFEALLAELATCLGHKLSKKQQAAYWEALREEMDLFTFERAFRHVRRSDTWFPRPAQLIAASRVGWT